MTPSTHISMRAARLSCLFAAFRGRIGVTTVARSLALSVVMQPVNAGVRGIAGFVTRIFALLLTVAGGER